jgi:hypothetical protein
VDVLITLAAAGFFQETAAVICFFSAVSNLMPVDLIAAS